MRPILDHAPALATDVIDFANAVLSAAWPRSLASREMERLVDDGYVVGAVYQVDFALAVEPGDRAELALSAAALEGFHALERTPDAHGFITVRAPVRLRAYDLVRAASRLNRAVERYGAYAEVIGPVAIAPTDRAA